MLLLEAQSDADDRLEERLCDYCVRVMRTHRLPVAVAVLFLRRDACPSGARRGDTAIWGSPPVGGRTALRLAYQPVRVWELDGATALQVWGPELAPLVPLMDHGGQAGERVVQASLRRALEAPNPRLREDVYTCTAALAALRYDLRLVRRLVEEQIRNTPGVGRESRIAPQARHLRPEG